MQPSTSVRAVETSAMMSEFTKAPPKRMRQKPRCSGSYQRMSQSAVS